MNVQISYHRQFIKDLKRLAKKYKSLREDFAGLLASLEENPLMGTDLGNGTRKIRLAVASKGKGKSGGARAITFIVRQSEETTFKVVLLTLYDKNELANVSDAFIKQLVSTMDE